MLRQCATTAITAVHAASIRFAMPAMLGRLVAQLKMPRLDAYPGSTGAFDVVVASYALERIDIKAFAARGPDTPWSPWCRTRRKR